MTQNTSSAWMDWRKTAADRTQRLSDIQFNCLDQLLRQQTEMASIYLDSQVKQLEILGETTEAKAWLAAQSRLAHDVGKKTLQNWSATTEIMLNTTSQFSDWAEKSLNAAQELSASVSK